jgi:alkylhydroperoxidase family enzyme
MAILQIGYMTRSVYEYTHHIKISRDFGVSDEDIRAIANESKGLPSQLDALTQAVLRAAREMTQNFAASDTTFNELKAHLDKESLTDLVLIISFYNAVVRFLATMEIDNEPEYQALLAEFPFATD